jgi:hypothetical protein
MFLGQNSVGKMNMLEESMFLGRTVILKMDKSKLSISHTGNKAEKSRNPHKCG